MPDTTPPALTVAMPVAPLIHVPPVIADDKVVVLPTHTLSVPVTAGGVATTVSVRVA